jgi:small-conductance mechanosensitive channel
MTFTSAPQAQVVDSLQVAASQVAEVLKGSGSLVNIVLTLAVIIGAWGVRRIVMSVVRRSVEDQGTRYFVGKAVGYVTLSVAILAIGAVWFRAFGSIGTFLGLLTAGIAIALRDLIADLAGWIFILTRRPFEIGDRIEIAGHRGDVVDISAFQFTLLEVGNWVAADQSTGRVIHVPNAEVLRLPVANSTVQFPFIWNELPVLVTFESDWRRAKKVLTEIAQKRAGPIVAQAERALQKSTRKYLIRYTTLTPTVYTDVQESGVNLTVRYLCAPRRRRSSAQEVWEDTLDAFSAEPDIDLAYPTMRTYLNALEGKRGARAPLPAAWVGTSDGAPGVEGVETPQPPRFEDPKHSGPALVDDP